MQQLHIFHVHYSLRLCQKAFLKQITAKNALLRRIKQVVSFPLVVPSLLSKLPLSSGRKLAIYLTWTDTTN